MTEENAPSRIWEIDSTDPDKAEIVRSSLREVLDPEIGLSVVELGLVRQVALEAELHIEMILTTPFCPYGPALLEMTRSKAEEASGSPTKIEIGPQVWEPSMMEGGAGAAWGLY
jgi:metal-sulfur cluster biosynthetic enzyme